MRARKDWILTASMGQLLDSVTRCPVLSLERHEGAQTGGEGFYVASSHHPAAFDWSMRAVGYFEQYIYPVA